MLTVYGPLSICWRRWGNVDPSSIGGIWFVVISTSTLLSAAAAVATDVAAMVVVWNVSSAAGEVSIGGGCNSLEVESDMAPAAAVAAVAVDARHG